MEQDNISTIQEKIVGIEAVFSTLQSEEKESAVGLIEEYLRKLKDQIKPDDVIDACNVSFNAQTESTKANEHDERTTQKHEKPKKVSKGKKGENVLPSPVVPEPETNMSNEKAEKEIKVSSRGRKTRLRHSYAEDDNQNEYDEYDIDNDIHDNPKHEVEKVSKPKGKRRKPPTSTKPKPTYETHSKTSDKITLKSDHISKDTTKPIVPKKVRKKPKFRSKCKEKRSYIQKKTFSCKACGKMFNHYKTMAVHLKTHGTNPMCCRHCRTELINEIELMHHNCQVNSTSKYTCPICGEKFNKKKHCKLHMYEQHDVKNYKLRDPKNVCRFCNRTFIRKVSLFMHYKVHAETSFVCLKCGEICADFTIYTNHMHIHEKAASFECKKCGASFERKQQYVQHLAGHDKYDCPDCGMCFTRNKQLLRHRRDNHGDVPLPEPKKFECDVCNKLFRRRRQLEIHTRIHTGERPLECTVCQLSFRTSKALAKHKQTYNHCVKAGHTTSEKKYLCSECGKAYFRKQALQRHIRYHTGDKPHTCQYCGYKCREQNNLKRHIALHFENLRNFICEVCGAAFHAKKTLEMHFKYKHTEIRDYPCPECPMSFKAKNALKRHVKTHEKTKDHKCWCGSAFGRMYNLRRHMRMVHGDEESLPPVRKVAVLDAEETTKQAVKSPPAKRRTYKPKQIQPIAYKTESTETIIMNVVHDHVVAHTSAQQPPPHPQQQQQILYTLPPPQHSQVAPHMTEEQHSMVYDTINIPQSMMAYSHNAPPAPPIGAETVVDNHAQQQQQQQQQHADYYNNPSMLEAQANDYNNPYMYIQNVLLPSVAMAGLLDLSHAPPPPSKQ